MTNAGGFFPVIIPIGGGKIFVRDIAVHIFSFCLTVHNISDGNICIARAVCRSWRDYITRVFDFGFLGNSAIIHAIRKNYEESVKFLIKQPSVDTLASGGYAIIESASKAKMLQIMLDDPRIKGKPLPCELILSCALGDEIFGDYNSSESYLILAKDTRFARVVNPNRMVTYLSHNIPLILYASSIGNFEVVKEFLKQPGTDVNTNEGGLLLDSVRTHNKEIVELLLGFPDIIISFNSNIAARIALEREDMDIFKLLMCHKNMQIQDHPSEMLELLTRIPHSLEQVQILLEAGASPADWGNKALHNALYADFDCLPTIKLLMDWYLDKLDGVKESSEEDAMIVCCKKCNIPLLEYLRKERGIFAKVQWLLYAIEGCGGDTAFIGLLLTEGILWGPDKSAYCRYYNTAILSACRKDFKNVIDLLLEHEDKIDIANAFDRTAIEKCEKMSIIIAKRFENIIVQDLETHIKFSLAHNYHGLLAVLLSYVQRLPPSEIMDSILISALKFAFGKRCDDYILEGILVVIIAKVDVLKNIDFLLRKIISNGFTKGVEMLLVFKGVATPANILCGLLIAMNYSNKAIFKMLMALNMVDHTVLFEYAIKHNADRQFVEKVLSGVPNRDYSGVLAVAQRTEKGRKYIPFILSLIMNAGSPSKKARYSQ